MKLENYSQSRLNSILELISSLKDIDFPYDHSRKALSEVEKYVNRLNENLSILLVDPIRFKADIATLSTRILESQDTILPLLGYILRSTNVRNAFEMCPPTRRMAQKLLGNNTRLLLSSEWEYSPFTLKPIAWLGEFVIIGFPAIESANPLFLPLAGHELGHSLWAKINFVSAVSLSLKDSIIRLVQTEYWDKFKDIFPDISGPPEKFGDTIFDMLYISPATGWAEHQAKEMFCDFTGLQLFGTSYLHSFAFALVPGHVKRSKAYPRLKTRCQYLLAAAKTYNIKTPQNFNSLFLDRPLPSKWNEKDGLFVELADRAVDENIDFLIKKTQSIVTGLGFKLPDEKAINSVIESFENVVPCLEEHTLAEILNGGWEVYLDPKFLKGHPMIEDKETCLKDVILKSIEILEYNERIK